MIRPLSSKEFLIGTVQIPKQIERYKEILTEVRDKDIGTGRERQAESDRQTDIHTKRQTERDRQTKRLKKRQTDSNRGERQSDRWERYSKAERQTDRQT